MAKNSKNSFLEFAQIHQIFYKIPAIWSKIGSFLRHFTMDASFYLAIYM